MVVFVLIIQCVWYVRQNERRPNQLKFLVEKLVGLGLKNFVHIFLNYEIPSKAVF